MPTSQEQTSETVFQEIKLLTDKSFSASHLPMKPNLLIFGASVRAQVESAIRAGFPLEAYDLFGDADTQTACRAAEPAQADVTRIDSFDQIPELIRQRKTGAQSEIAIVCGGVEDHEQSMQAIIERLPLCSCSLESIMALRIQDQRFDAYQQSGCRIAPTFKRLPDGANPTDWLRKPIRGSGGLRIRVARPGDLISNVSSNHVFQQRVEGKSCSALYLANKFESAKLIGMTKQLVGDTRFTNSPFAYCGSIGPSRLDFTSETVVVQLGKILTKRFGLRGLFGVDLIVNKDGVWPVDVNPRIPASAEVFEKFDRATNDRRQFNMIEAQLGLMNPTDVFHENFASSETTCGKAIVFNQTAHSLRVDEMVQQKLLGLHNSYFFASDIPNVGNLIDPNEPIVTVHAIGKSEQVVEGLLLEGAEQARRCWM